MIIERDERIEKMFLETIQANLLKRKREGIHLSDLLSLKQAYWRKKKPLPATKSQIIYWLSGLAHESALLHISEFKHGKAQQWEDVWYTPDIMLGIPIEVKTSRRGFQVKPGQEWKQYSNYLEQLRGYCALTNMTEGWLVVWYLIMMDEKRRNTEPDFFAYKVNFTEEELEETRKDILKRKELLIQALDTNDITILPDCEQWKCYKEHSRMLEKPYCHTCQKEFATDWGINKHITSKTGKDKKTGKPHDVKKAVYDTANKPKCEYMEWCKPEMYKQWLEWKAKYPEEDEEANG